MRFHVIMQPLKVCVPWRKALDDYQYVQEQSPDCHHSCDVKNVPVLML